MSYVNAPVHDLLIRVRNGYMARKTKVQWVVCSKFKLKILELLQKYGFIKGFNVREDWKKKYIDVYLNEMKNPIDDIPEIKFYSKPSRPWYVGYKELSKVAGGKGIGIVSTNQGLIAAHEAKAKKLGGELIAEIY